MATRDSLRTLPAVSFDTRSDYLVVMTGSSPEDVLIRLPCFPQNPEVAGSPKGVLAYIVFDACTVLTRNRTPEDGSMLEFQGARMPVVRQNDEDTAKKAKGKQSKGGKGKSRATSAEDDDFNAEGVQKRWRTKNLTHMVSLLRPGFYRFFRNAKNREAEVNVCRSFRDWRWPDVIPLHWRRLNKAIVDRSAAWSEISKRVKFEDQECPFTKQTSGRESCHLIPKAEEYWYMEHALGVRAGDPQANINSPNNIMGLRADWNKQGFDAGNFVFVPALSELDMDSYPYDPSDEDPPDLPAPLDPPFMIFFLNLQSPDLTHSHHMRALPLPKRIPGEYVYARFAYNVFLIAFGAAVKTGGDDDEYEPSSYRSNYGDDHPPRDNPSENNDPDLGGGPPAPEARKGLRRSTRNQTASSSKTASNARGKTKQGTSDAPPSSKKAKYTHSEDAVNLDLNPVWRDESGLLGMERYDRTLMDPKVWRPILQNAQYNGIEPGFSQPLRAAYNWAQTHPVKLVNATVGRAGEGFGYD
ncbi:hypothetical protein B0H15DRAFT_1020495 [Mycena belliarum]|uniref:HNH nuclease domain-containing protein n=1 Tax=Mycena belliarum TaxID=1033014 RepID=A0AAD6UET8_9AGAR|nr:hypothetical protein B0H15DRAFT_1020495 [Mycena belliae]